MMSIRLRSVPIQTSQTRILRGGIHAPSPPLLRRVSVIRRFKAGNDETEAEILKRRASEDVIRKQEETLKQASKDVSNAAGSAKDELKKDVGRVVQGVERSSAGKGYASAVKVPIWMPAFTRRREIFIGRIAMVGFLATCGLEVLLPGHPGPIHQVQLWSGLDEASVVAIALGIVIFNVVGGLGPWSPTFAVENLRDVAKRPPGPPERMPRNIGELLGVSGWGFTKRNELFHGRLAMLGFLAAFINEIKSGRGALGQVAGYLGIVPDDTYYSFALNGFALFAALMLGLSLLAPSRLQGAAEPEDDIY